jgi:hypothetical protein
MPNHQAPAKNIPPGLRTGGERWGGGGSSGGGGGRGRFDDRGGDSGGALSRELIDEAQSLTATPVTDADGATADHMGKYIDIAKSTDSDSGKTSRLTALLRQEENHSLLECFRGEGQWHGHGAEAHFEGAPNWKVVIAKLAGVFYRGGDKGSGGGDRWREPHGGGAGGRGGGGSFGGRGRDFGGGRWGSGTAVSALLQLDFMSCCPPFLLISCLVARLAC